MLLQVEGRGCTSCGSLRFYIGRICGSTTNRFQLKCKMFDVLGDAFGHQRIDVMGSWGGVAGGGGKVVRFVSCRAFILGKCVVQLLIGCSCDLKCLMC